MYIGSPYVGLKLPPIVKKRGRPKGHMLTVSGLPAKRSRKPSKKPTSFRLMHSSDKEKGKSSNVDYCVVIIIIIQLFLLGFWIS